MREKKKKIVTNFICLLEGFCITMGKVASKYSIFDVDDIIIQFSFSRGKVVNEKKRDRESWLS